MVACWWFSPRVLCSRHLRGTRADSEVSIDDDAVPGGVVDAGATCAVSDEPPAVEPPAALLDDAFDTE